jgi:hypothetical protein
LRVYSRRGLCKWATLVAWRVVAILVATALHAHIAASTATLLLSLGVNRLAAAAVIVGRAMAMGVPFAPEKDGKVFMAGTFDRGFGARDGLGARFGRGGDEGRRGFNGRDGQGAWRGVPGGRLRRGGGGAGPGSASAEDLAGDSRSKFQRYLILLLEWPLRRRGEDHRVPSGASYTTIQTIRTLHRDAPQTRVVPGRLHQDGNAKCVELMILSWSSGFTRARNSHEHPQLTALRLTHRDLASPERTLGL